MQPDGCLLQIYLGVQICLKQLCNDRENCRTILAMSGSGSHCLRDRMRTTPDSPRSFELLIKLQSTTRISFLGIISTGLTKSLVKNTIRSS